MVEVVDGSGGVAERTEPALRDSLRQRKVVAAFTTLSNCPPVLPLGRNNRGADDQLSVLFQGDEGLPAVVALDNYGRPVDAVRIQRRRPPPATPVSSSRNASVGRSLANRAGTVSSTDRSASVTILPSSFSS